MLKNGRVKCETCVWYEANQPDTSQGVCMFNPPVPLPVPMQPSIARTGMPSIQAGAMGMRPPTQAAHRCHHHPDWHQTLQ